MDTSPASRTTASGSPPTGKRVVVTAFGSLGDLHPYLAIALGLESRGHEAVLVTSACYRRKVEALGLGFRAMRPDSTFVDDPAVMRRVMDLRTGLEHVLRRVILPAVRESYEDTLAAAEGADLLVSHPICFAAGLVAEATGTPWASTMVTPLGLSSAYDPPTLPGYTGLSGALRPLGPAFWGPLRRLLKRATRPWAGPIDRLRADLGLPPAVAHPLVDGHSPSLHLALFSKRLSAEQPDWPPQTVITGFPFFDRDGEAGLPPDLARFLDDGPPPVVFTLGDSASTVAGRFYRDSAEAAVRLGRRAVLVLKDPRNRPPSLPEGVTAVEYAPFSGLFPRSALIVHHGGVGTTGLAMRSGRPMLVVPFAHDQPDNAARLTRLGVARTLDPRRYTPARAEAELRLLLDDPAYSQRATEVGGQVREEDGVRAACDALEGLLRWPGFDAGRRPPPGSDR
jgi:UDP:flavonoid glycosyltransferase YjiC (YdhE family)